ncbi:UNVERIFIED_ORG: DNA-binding NtrC family response regulator [Methylobacterium sp. SuP10 SLI 274]|uniref:response regulator n=1 Tax=Methylorubrum extorquens TaxID=408 RepID=UPI0020A16456|nr:response regulator [Methylorubrum extorquens]MDF9863198.1 DNA-binding NtrC family response regulator [Methylorubrum pseudosasae]MDH6636809.1 DNA-binding NtrC family response regulator [Methylobacterium sp. SuP10 SLI 274]MDH6665986.1 DNA-binding NtrC family response regulator [Methylorubrum zatmanii]MCP1557901.1 DNA-binding NtrC family response regulator [Methylorubrum extorquens]MDF9791505.1 DNA-binding NtrC family response regulator [Methylorubrum extorquens]
MTDPADLSIPYALVVDDGFIRMDAMDILQEAEFRTFEASDGDKAIALLDREHALIVLVFTDVQIPCFCDGFAVARETARRWPYIAIVVASGQAHPGPGDMPGGARFIGKPFTAEMVHDHLKEILPDGRKPARFATRLDRPVAAACRIHLMAFRII